MTGWAYFEGGYAGGVDTIDLFSGTTRAGLPSLTDTFFAPRVPRFREHRPRRLRPVFDLRADGQVNNPDVTEATRNWLQHTLVGTAPAGTVSVRVRASMLDGEFNVDLPHQAAWVDDFSLRAVPEPSTCLLGLLSLALVGLARRIAVIGSWRNRLRKPTLVLSLWEKFDARISCCEARTSRSAFSPWEGPIESV